MPVSDPALVGLAHRHMPAAVAARWAALQRLALRLRVARLGEPVVAWLGGVPPLPAEVGWPRWKGQGWLNFVAAIDCAHVPVGHLDVAWPDTGTLLLFYRDPEADEFQTIVESSVPETQAGVRVIYVPDGTSTKERRTPDGLKTYARVALAADAIVTGPDWEHPEFRAAIEDLSAEDRRFMDDPVSSDPFEHAMWDREPRPRHRIGGHAHPLQGGVEVEVAMTALGGRVDYTDPALREEARRWTLLAQIDTDDAAGMAWGDAGALYWVIRREDLLARRFDAAMLTWQAY